MRTKKPSNRQKPTSEKPKSGSKAEFHAQNALILQKIPQKTKKQPRKMKKSLKIGFFAAKWRFFGEGSAKVAAGAAFWAENRLQNANNFEFPWSLSAKVAKIPFFGQFYAHFDEFFTFRKLFLLFSKFSARF